MTQRTVLAFLGLVVLSKFALADTPKLDIQSGDHVSFVGNTLADRMQRDGWLETLLQARFRDSELVIRNLGFSGDELTLRLRSAGFGTPDEHLAANKTDVLFAFFGYNESFRGKAGLEAFKGELAEFIERTLAQRYNGKSAPRLILFSPIAHEDHHSPNLPDGKENNERIVLYTDAMKQVAQSHNCVFVDLYRPTLELYEQVETPLTINGIHLTELGNRNLAFLIDEALFGPRKESDDESERLERIRQAVLEKNFYWYNRYRTVDGYSIFGGRADLKFVDGQTNREVMQRELEVLDVMTANRDPKIWAAARGIAQEVNDDNTPPFIPVKTNKPGAGPNGEHLFLDGAEAIKDMTVAAGMKVNLVASEKEFPELINPVQMAFDVKGRLWAAVWPTYPHWRPKEEMNDKLLIFEDDNNDGAADRCKVFADGLHNPTGFEFWGGGVFVAMAPDLLFLKDTDGDDRADVRVRVISGLDTADTHHTANSFTLDPAGALYFQEGTFHHTQVETPYGPPQRCANGGVFRYEPRTQKFEVYVTHPFANPHGHVFDRWGQDFVYDGTGSNPYHGLLFSGHLEFPQKHATPPQVYQQRTRPCPAVEILSSRHFPDEMQGNLLVENVIGFQGILQYKVSNKDSSFGAEEVEPILSSTDPSFRPVDLEIGPDGAIWFVDWQNPIIGHMQHNLRDPSRDRIHGRIYRVTYPSRPLLRPIEIAGQPIERLLELLKEPEDRVRCRARIELSGRVTADVMTALDRWLASLDPSDAEYEHHRLEGLWLRANHNVVDLPLLEQVLSSPDFRARAAATKLISYWRDRIPDVLAVLRKQAGDSHPRVRLEAVRAASFFGTAEAIEIPLAAAKLPTDAYIDFVRGETMKALEPALRQAIVEGRDIAPSNDAALGMLLRGITTGDLMRAKRTRAICLELLTRRGVQDEVRKEALDSLAKLTKQTSAEALLATLDGLGVPESDVDDSVLFDLARVLTSLDQASLAAVRSSLEELATNSKRALLRQIGYAALIRADASTDKAWGLAKQSLAHLRDLVAATPLVKDISLRGELYDRTVPLLDGLPKELEIQDAPSSPVGRYVRIELPGRRTLTLAEVEVFQGGQNIARSGKASQKSTAFNGEASRAIDGNTSGRFGDGGQTHSAENFAEPWWELDLGRNQPIEAITIHNRTEGELGHRLDGFSLIVMDENRKTVFRQDQIPAPVPKTTIEIGPGNPRDQLLHAAMAALAAVPGKEAQSFQRLAPFAAEGPHAPDAIHALLSIPVKFWPKESASSLAPAVLTRLRETPVQDRTSAASLDVLQFGEALASLLPAEEGAKVRKELRELGVQIVRLSTLTDRMLYDKEVLAVEAGKAVEVLFENNDIMPHNLVFVSPGSLEEVGLLAESMATQPSAVERHYVPATRKVLASSRLLQPRQAERLKFQAPREPGVYPYVCTYPGHWRRMYGALYVVADLEGYLANPSAYIASNSLQAVDELLKFSRPRQEWKFDDLAGSLPEAEKGRSFASAKTVFQIANCIACHRMNGVGYEIGPDLAKLDPKKTPEDILRSMIEPSAKIEDKYATAVFELESGKVVTGLVVEENDAEVKVVENPLTKSDAITIAKNEIADRQNSKTSAMPLGVLDRLTREEILDLLAYLIARGDARHEVFSSSHGGHGH